jgi:TetR/AcrR family transcriptional regulator, fatty acid metabolism regulator protein
MQKGVPISERMNLRLRERFFHLATEHLIQAGYAQTSYKELARLLEIDPASLRSYFPDKEAFLLFFVEEEMSCTLQEAERMSSSKRPAADKLKHILDYLWAYLNENRALSLFTARHAAALSEHARQRITLRQRRYRQILEKIIIQGIESGEFRRVAPRITADSLYDLIMAPFSDWLLYSAHEDIETELDDRLDLFLHGIQMK